MTFVTVERHRLWFRKPFWSATFPNGKRTYTQGFYLYDTKKFKSFSALLKYAEGGNFLDVSPGGGEGVGVKLILDGMIIGEYWQKIEIKNGNVVFRDTVCETYPRKLE